MIAKRPRMLASYARAAAAVIPGTGRVPFLPGGGGEIPDLTLRQERVIVNRRHLAVYREVCGFGPGPELPCTYPHVLAFGLHMKLLSDGRFPLAPIGLVHVENRILQQRVIPVGELLQLDVRALPAQPHPAGVTFAIATDAAIAGETVWSSTSTMLRRSGSPREDTGGAPRPSTPAGAAGPRRLTPGAAEGDLRGTWRLEADLGRRYAAISGDRNPIHMHPLSARAFGFPGAIAHGMWSLARVCAALGEQADAHAVEVSFRKPAVLPSTVQLTSRATEGETEFALRAVARNAVHLRGRIWAPAEGPEDSSENERQAT